MKTTKKIITAIVLCLIICGLIFGAVWASTNWSKIQSGTNLYTEQELLDYGEERYQAGVEQGEKYKIQLQESLAQIAVYENQIKQNIQDLEAMTQERDAAQAETAEERELRLATEAENETLRQQILELQNEITRLNGLIAGYEDIKNGTVEIDFYVNDTLYATKVVYCGRTLVDSIKAPTLEGYIFLYWAVDDEQIDLDTYVFNSDTTVKAKFREAQVVYGTTWSETESNVAVYGSYVWTDGESYYYSSGSNQYVLDVSTHTWSAMTWTGLTSFYGDFIWTDGESYYYSYNSTTQYVLDVSTHTWSTMTLSGLTVQYFYPSHVWTDGENCYYSYGSTQYVLDVSTHTWSTMTWTGLTSFYGTYVWTDGENYYYSKSSAQYVLDVSTHTWSTMTWSGLSPAMVGFCIWSDGTNIYYSRDISLDNPTNGHYILDKSTHTWSEMTWTGLTSFSGDCVWTDGENYYYSYGGDQYVLSKSYI